MIFLQPLLLALAAEAAGEKSCASGEPPSAQAVLQVRGAMQRPDVDRIFAAERAAWGDPFLAKWMLANETRNIAGAVQSVTWLHRHREEAGGAIERAEAAAVAAQERAGWMLAPQLNGVRCVESIRYTAGGDGDGDSDDSSQKQHDPEQDDGWHTDEWSTMTAVLVLSTTSDLRGGDLELDRGGGPALATQEEASPLQAGDLLVFRSWDAHRSRPVLRGRRHILVLEFWLGPKTLPDSTVGRPAELDGGRAVLCPPALEADPQSAALLWFCSQQQQPVLRDAEQETEQAADSDGADGSISTAAGALGRDPAWMLGEAARLVGDSAFLWEMAAAARVIPVLDALTAVTTGTSGSGTRG